MSSLQTTKVTEQTKFSPKVNFLIQNLPKIVELENQLREKLSEKVIKATPSLQGKIQEGGWLIANQVFEL